MTKFAFLVVGASSGLGLQLAREALKAGHSVVATARNVAAASQDHPEVQELGGSWYQLDVTHADTSARLASVARENGVNVLVNCAGYAILGSLEDTEEDEFIQQINTNTFGTMRCIKGVLPYFRSLGSEARATIVNIGTLLSHTAFPATSAYTASKRAVEGMTESLAMEVGSVGIRVVLIDLGIFRTNFLNVTSKPKAGLGGAYAGGSVDATVAALDNLSGKQPGDPVEGAKRIVEIVSGSGLAKNLANKGFGPVLRVPLGSDSFNAAMAGLKSMGEGFQDLERIASSTDFAEDNNAI